MTEKDVCGGTAQGQMVQEALAKKGREASHRKEMAQKAASVYSASIRMVCLAFGFSETYYRYQPILSDKNMEIADWLIRLTHKQKEWVFGLCHDYLRSIKGFGWNHKRIYRIYCERS